MSQNKQQREKCLRQYIVFRVKLIEFVHLHGMLTELTASKTAPSNDLDHTWKHYGDTLLNTLMAHLNTMMDSHKDGLNIIRIWCFLFPDHKRSIERCWTSYIEPGFTIIRDYRDNAGAHAGNLAKFLKARGTLMRSRKKVLAAIGAFLSLAICILKREDRELPEFTGFIETTLLDLELENGWSFNRRWLRDWKLLESGSYSKKYT